MSLTDHIPLPDWEIRHPDLILVEQIDDRRFWLRYIGPFDTYRLGLIEGNARDARLAAEEFRQRVRVLNKLS